MDINDQLDQNAADLRNVPTQPPEANAPVPPAGEPPRSVSKTEIALAIGIMVGIVVIVYFLLQGGVFSPAAPPSQPLPGLWNYPTATHSVTVP